MNKYIKTNCFAYDEKNQKCMALNGLWCAFGKGCKFYKNKKDYQYKERNIEY